MSAPVLEFPAWTETLRTARQVVSYPDLFGREDVHAACQHLMARGDYMDYRRGEALMEVLEAEALLKADAQRSMAEIAADVPESDWVAGAAIIFLTLGALLLIGKMGSPW
jgi:hypothetical protein